MRRHRKWLTLSGPRNLTMNGMCLDLRLSDWSPFQGKKMASSDNDFADPPFPKKQKSPTEPYVRHCRKRAAGRGSKPGRSSCDAPPSKKCKGAAADAPKCPAGATSSRVLRSAKHMQANADAEGRSSCDAPPSKKGKGAADDAPKSPAEDAVRKVPTSLNQPPIEHLWISVHGLASLLQYVPQALTC